jgi:hypothetical protein
VTIRIGDREETHLLQRLEGLPFRIEIKNMDYGANAVSSDMPDYYKYLASAGPQVELVPCATTPAGNQSIRRTSVTAWRRPASIDEL